MFSYACNLLKMDVSSTDFQKISSTDASKNICQDISL